jgi:hypothetical protein
MRFQANPDDIISLVVTRLTSHTNFTAREIIIGKNEKNKRLDDKKSPVDICLTRNEPKEKPKNNEITYFRSLFNTTNRNTSVSWELFFTPKCNLKKMVTLAAGGGGRTSRTPLWIRPCGRQLGIDKLSFIFVFILSLLFV